MMIPKPNKFMAILSLVPGAEITSRGPDEVIEWHKPTTSPVTEEQIQAELERLTSIWNYQSPRALEYPSLSDQLDTLYHEGYDGWKAQIQAIKDKYPKGA
jgi:hypothetical protein